MNNNLQFKKDKFAYSDVRQKASKKLFAVVISIILSFVFALLIASGIYNDIGLFVEIPKRILSSCFSGVSAINTTISSMAILIVSSLAFLIAFKAGLFNMGISGQMLAGATGATIFAQFINLPNGIGQVVILIISVAIAMSIAGAIGAMKAYLNVNEVVSSIMFNWIIYFFSSYLLKFTSNPMMDSTDNISSNYTFAIDGASYIPLISMAVVLAVIIFLYLGYTVAGKKAACIGLNKNASKSAGYNVKSNIVYSMMISGVLAGILGVMVYCGYQTQMPTSTVAKTIPLEGFNGISVGLISMCSPLAVIPISLIFSTIQGASPALQSISVDSNLPNVIFGIVVYGAAIISLFILFKPYWFSVKLIKGGSYVRVLRNKQLDLTLLNEYTYDNLDLLKRFYKNDSSSSKMKNAVKFTVYQKIKMKIVFCQFALLSAKRKMDNWIRTTILKKEAKVFVIDIKVARMISLKTGMYYRRANIKRYNAIESEFLIGKKRLMNYDMKEIVDKKQYQAYRQMFVEGYIEIKKYINDFYQKKFVELQWKDKNRSFDQINAGEMFKRYDDFVSSKASNLEIIIPDSFKPYGYIFKCNHEQTINNEKVKIYNMRDDDLVVTLGSTNSGKDK